MLIALITLACTGDNITATDLGDTGPVTSPDDQDGDGYTPDDGDCDDFNGDVNPGQVESCDGVDNDCDGETDEDAVDATSLYADVDGDGYGNTGNAVRSCGTVEGRVEQSGDCDDNDAEINPGAAEVCDEWQTDEDCDGLADDEDESVDTADMTTWYYDSDGDGYGDAAVSDSFCHGGSDWVEDDTDCDDTDEWLTPENECDLGWNGEYTGSFEYTASLSGFSDTCSGSMTVIFDEFAEPPMTGSFSCTWALLGTSDTVIIDGDLSEDETGIFGALQVGDAVLDDYDGTVTDEPRFSASFSGVTEVLGQAADYTGSFDVAR
ncbi:MAG: hypothetical protein GY913_12635 [Proteobacteria bacterium]|nr:hypothetical protein [Pseudomonadota bacterium]MCP4917752.1 hypothetical protein [Pseudomonadota bacterium]